MEMVKINWKSFRWSIVLPLVMLVYILAYIDRINISFAMAGMSKELGMTSSVGGFISGLFFLGYTVLQLPAGHLASRVSARRNILWLSILWAGFSALQGFAQNVNQLAIVRFLLGVVEGGMFPSVYVLVANWFPAKERGRATAFFVFYSTIAPLIMSPLSGVILQNANWFGWASWRWLFMLEALPGAVVAIVLYWLVADNPHSQKNLKPEERDYLVKALTEEAAQPKVVNETSYWKALFHPAFVLLTLAFFFRVIGNYGTQVWMPTIVKGISGFGDQMVGFVLAIPWLAATVGLVVIGWLNDRYDNKKALILVGQILAGLSFVGMYYFGAANVWLSILCLTISITGMVTVVAVYFSILPQLISKEMVGGLTGIFAALGNIGGFVGPFAVGYLMSGGNQMAGLAFLASMLLLSTICIACIKINPQNATSQSFVLEHNERNR
jgi:MFS family permease